MLGDTSSTSPGRRMDTPYVAILVGAVGSTQDEARRRFGGTPVLVSAEHQHAGRGRSAATWLGADRAVAASLAFRPSWPAAAWPRLTLVAGLAARAAAGDPVRLAWPNDLMLGDLKVGGLITESAGGVVVAGFGLNLSWDAPIAGAGALHESDPGVGEAHRIAEAWAGDLLGRLGAGPDEWGIDEYRKFSSTLGTRISWDPDGLGQAVDIAVDGGLVVDTAAGRRVLDSGVVRRVRESGSGREPRP